MKRRRKAHRRQNELPSGRYRVQVAYKGEDGKRHTKSFTADTLAEAQAAADDFREGKKYHEGTVADAVDAFLTARKGVLSPSTYRSYKSIQRSYLNGAFGLQGVTGLSSDSVQAWISDLAGKVKPKTVKNAYALFRSAMEIALPDKVFRVKLPQRERPDLYCPSDADIKLLLDSITDRELKIAVRLAAFCTLRRGEICALTMRDIKGGAVSISKSLVRGEGNEWHTKPPKTFSSYRSVPVPGFVLGEIDALERGSNDRIINYTPDKISRGFERAVKRAGLPHIRFHDLRHYSASILHAIGVPDQYILARGGWSTDGVMKTVYRNVIYDEAKKQDEKIAEHFEGFV